MTVKQNKTQASHRPTERRMSSPSVSPSSVQTDPGCPASSELESRSCSALSPAPADRYSWLQVQPSRGTRRMRPIQRQEPGSVVFGPLQFL